MPAMTPSGATTFPGPGSLTPSLTRGSVVVSQAPPPARPAWLRWVAAGAVVVMAALAGALMVKLLSPRSASVSASSQTSAVTASTECAPASGHRFCAGRARRFRRAPSERADGPTQQRTGGRRVPQEAGGARPMPRRHPGIPHLRGRLVLRLRAAGVPGPIWASEASRPRRGCPSEGTPRGGESVFAKQSEAFGAHWKFAGPRKASASLP